MDSNDRAGLRCLRKLCAHVNGDGKLTRDELLTVYKKIVFRPPWSEVKDKKIIKQAREDKAGFSASDALLYHDNDEDGVVLCKFSKILLDTNQCRRS